MVRTFVAILLLGIGSAACGALARPETPAPRGTARPANAEQPADPHDHHIPGPHHAEGDRPPAGEPAEHAHAAPDDAPAPGAADPGAHAMWMQPMGAGWRLMGMAQLFPVVTVASPFDEETPLRRTEWVLTQPAAMFNVESPGGRFVLRTTLNFEGITLREGELTLGGWGEGYIDSRHPHTMLHELMLSVNLWETPAGTISIAGGKGFAPYGTDDPMARPVVKYPTNHHLSQILERWTLNGMWLRGPWSLEAGIFGGQEPTGPYDLSNIESFPDSWSARLIRRFGAGTGPAAAWELSASYAQVREVHDVVPELTRLGNVALRHSRRHALGDLYGLIEASRSRPEHTSGYFSVLAETQVVRGRHQPYYRVEYATRPEYVREGAAGETEFFRYNHFTHPVGATRWRIHSVGYSHELGGFPVSGRPFVEAQHHRIWWDQGLGAVAPQRLYNTDSVWKLSAGLRLYLGGGPMRMGSYGMLDPMTAMHRESAHGDHLPDAAGDAGHHHH